MSKPLPVKEQMQIWQERTNARHLVGDIGWFGLAIPAVGTFLSVYAIHLGATPLELGLLSSIPSIFMLLSTFAANWWLNRSKNALRATLWPGFWQRLRILLLAVVPFLPEAWRIPTLLAIMSLFAMPVGISNVTFLVLLRASVSDGQVTYVVSRRQLIMNLCIAGSTLVLGFWLERAPFPVNYQSMFVVAFGFTIISLWQVSRIKIINPQLDDPATTTGRLRFLRPWRDPYFRNMALCVALILTGYFSIVPIVPLHLVDGLGASEGFISIYFFLELMGSATSAYFANRLIDRFGHKITMLAGMTITALSAGLLAAAPSQLLALPAALINGGAWVLTDISQYSYYSASLRDAGKPSYTTGYFQAVSIAIFLGPLIGSSLANAGIDLRVVLLVGGGLRLLAGIVMQFYKPEETSVVKVAPVG
jgi:MFS family permease